MSYHADKAQAEIAVVALRGETTVTEAIEELFLERMRRINEHHMRLYVQTKGRMKSYAVIGDLVVPATGPYPLHRKIGPRMRRQHFGPVDGAFEIAKRCRRNRDADTPDELDESTVSLERVGWALSGLDHAAGMIEIAVLRHQLFATYGNDSALALGA